MGKAGSIIGIVAGIFGIFASIFTLLFGGLSTAFEAKGSGLIVGLGWGGVVYSFLVIVFGAIALSKPKTGGVGLTLSSIAGIALGGTKQRNESKVEGFDIFW